MLPWGDNLYVAVPLQKAVSMLDLITSWVLLFVPPLFQECSFWSLCKSLSAFCGVGELVVRVLAWGGGGGLSPQKG